VIIHLSQLPTCFLVVGAIVGDYMDDMLRTNLIHYLSNLLKKYAQTLEILEHILNVSGKCLVTTLSKNLES
jgi:hypothetical protein